jgi:hypothetical protein
VKNLSPPRRGQRQVVWLAAGALTVCTPAAATAVVQTWQAAAVSDPATSATVPNGFVDAAGDITSIWLQRSGSISRVAVATRPASTKAWTSPAPPHFVSKAGQNAVGLVSAGNAKGDAIAVWRVGGTVKESHRQGISGPWSEPVSLRTTTQTIGSMSVALNDKRDAVVTWTEGTTIKATSRDGVSPFIAPVTVTTVATTRIEHVFAGIDVEGNSHVAWDQLQSGSKGTVMGVYLARRPALSTKWIRSSRTDLGFDTRITSLAVRGTGNALMGTQQRNGTSMKAVVVPYTMTDTAITPGAARQFGGPGFATSNPVVATNSKGDGVIGYLSTADQKTYEVRLSSYAIASDTWTSPRTVASGPMQRGLALALSFTGVGVATWSETPTGTRRVRVSVRRTPDTPWEPPTTLNTQSGAAESTSMSERGGHFIATWVRSASSGTVANVGLLDTVAPKVTAGFRPTVSVRSRVTLRMNAIDGASTITDYDWTFWDDTPPAVGPVVVHWFKRTGNFRVTLKATDAAGNITRTQVIVHVVNSATVRGFPVLGNSLTCPTTILGAAITWRRGTTTLSTRARHVVIAADLGKRISCIAHTSKQSVTAAGRVVPRMCRIPAVVGTPVAAARFALRLRGCRVTVTTVAAGAAKVGKVLSSSLPAGRLVPNATLVRLRVGS